MDTRWFVEWDAHCQNVLRRHWPGLPVYGDITAVDWSSVEPVDVLAGGFPCQPVSMAGKGLAQADERWLWPPFFDAIRTLRPRYVFVENVAGLLQRGLGIVLGDLATLGYDVEWECVPASSVGAPHRRDRLWIVAYPNGERRGYESTGRAPLRLFGSVRPSLGRDWPLEPRVDRVGHGIPDQVDRLRALGNAVVPQVVEWIGRRIVAFDEARKVSAA